ncbi:MAG: M61 family peptidase [Acidobacteria bacterium]|nr:M61 family peptidase [Acidobacteriota bacterium]
MRRNEANTKRTYALLLLALSFVALTAAGARAQTRQQFTLAIDATEVPRKLFHARETIPVPGGATTLVYPKWIPGEHGPTGPVTDLVGLHFTAAGKPVTWRRDGADMYAFHLDVPPGAREIEATFDFLSATSANGFTSAASATPHLAIVTWNQLVLYPQGANPDELSYRASLTLPAGWKYGTALPVARGGARDRVEFSPVSLTTLIDSPVLAGEYFRAIPIDQAHNAVELDIAADSAAALEAPPEFVAHMRQLVAETDALFGARHYENYHFLLTLSDHVAHFGLEHHQSNDSRIPERSLVDKSVGDAALSVLPHEFTHSWNGKYRRPAGLATPDYQQPMLGELLWVYEGLTEYLGDVLTARSGLWTPEQYRDNLAEVAAGLDHRPGRGWRPLVDTTVAAQLLYNASGQWSAYRRGVDFYDEGELIWLDADTLIRERTNGQKSLDDFCKLFHGAPSTPPTVKPYTFDDVVNTLNQVTPYDWRGFLNARLLTTDPRAPLGGITRGGWTLTYNDTPNAVVANGEAVGGGLEAGYSLGLRIDKEGTIADVIPGMPAYAAGLGPNMKIVAVNERGYSSAGLRDAVTAAKADPRARIDLLVNNEDTFKTYSLNYHGGWLDPHLERASGAADTLGQIISAHAP